jgi:predicted NBD/HSP70 family sugar kinase
VNATGIPTNAGPRRGSKVVPEDARRNNRRLVLQRLFIEGPLSRADMARATGLTRPTVTDLVASLLAEGLVEEIGRRADQGIGKPATLVGVDPDARHVLAFDLSDDEHITAAEVDLTGKVVSRRIEPWRDHVGEQAFAQVLRLAHELVASATRPVLGVGIGSPGVVHDEGTVLEAARLRWSDMALGARMGESLGLPVHVTNDANAATIGEYTFGTTRGENLLLVRVGQGVGAGLLLGGHLYTGDRSAAGEIGHVVVDADGAACSCGKRGCLETTVTAPLLAQRLDGADPATRVDVLAGAGRSLGGALATVVAMLNVDDIVVSAPTDLQGEPFLRALATAIRERTMAAVGGHVELRYSTLGEDDVLLGAAVLVINRELNIA